MVLYNKLFKINMPKNELKMCKSLKVKQIWNTNVQLLNKQTIWHILNISTGTIINHIHMLLLCDFMCWIDIIQDLLYYSQTQL